MIAAHGWRYHAGDDPAWARPDFDDNRWDTLNPTRPRRELPRAVQTGISWLRLRFSDNLSQRALLLHAYQMGACEIYFDGRLVVRQGRLTVDPAQVVARGLYPPPGKVPAGGLAVHALAVRLAPWQPRWMAGVDYSSQEIVFLCTARYFWADEANHRKAATVFMVGFGALALLVLMHLAFSRYNPARRANLYFAGYALSAALVCFFGFGAISWVISSQAIYQFMFWWIIGLGSVSGICTVRALWDLFGLRPGRIYTGLWVGLGVMQLAQTFAPLHPLTAWVQAVLLALIYAEQLRLTVRALFQRRRGVWIIAIGFATGLVGVFGWLLSRDLLAVTAADLLDTYAALVLYLSVVTMFTAPGLGSSLYLAREFALDAALL